jgi:hypothetical protein
MENKDVDHEEFATTCLYELVIPFYLFKIFAIHYISSQNIEHDALPTPFIDSNVSLKWKQRKNKELGHAP